MSTSGGAAPLRLGPGWRKSGTGFQPPPAVPDREESRERSGSHASGGSGTGGGKDKNLNPFAMLDDEEDAAGNGTKTNKPSEPSSGGGRFSNLKESDNRPSPSRHPRSSSSGPSSGGGEPPKRGGRSLADLAKRVSVDGNRSDSRRDPRNHDRPSSAGITRVRSGSGEGLGHGNYDRDRSASHGSSGGMEDSGAKVIRYTREKLLSLRGRGDDDIPGSLKALEDSVVVSKTSQDPVCWDTFDSDEIWASTAHRGDRRASDRGPPGPSNRDDRGPPPTSRGSMDRGPVDRGPMDRGRSSGGGNSGFGSGRWQRGVTVPDKETRPDSRGRSGGGNNAPARDTDDLWDDPTPTTGAASDFSAFGGSLEDDLPKGKSGMSGAFDLGDMSAAASAFESELHGDKASKRGSDINGGIGGALEDEEGVTHKVDSSRPLAGTGTTINSGSGDGVNVFEDFGDDDNEEKEDDIPIKSGTGANNASSRLMGMIGVAGTGEASGSGGMAEPTTTTDDNDAKKPEPEDQETKPRSDSILSNPWGAPAVSSNPWGGNAAAADSSANKQKEEEKKRWADAQVNQQAEKEKQEAAAKEAKVKAEQMKAQQIQVELVLIERISNILENSWGRSDLPSILSTLHANDSRVIAILSTVDALRQLIARHELRIQMGRDPTMGAEMAALRMTNVQWKAHEAREAQAKSQAQEQELQRQRQLQAEKEAMARAQMEAEERRKQQLQQQQSVPPVTDAPWYYADPQGNIQGPFGGDEMRQWLEAGYFKGDLPISQNTKGPFLALNSYFSGDPSNAFKPADNGAAKAREAAEAKARAEAEQIAAREQAENEAKARAQAEAEKNNQQSTQLKMMLGLGGGGSSSDGIAGPPQPEPVTASEPTPSQPTKKQGKKPAQKQKQSEPDTVAQAAPVPAPEPAAPPAPAWGGAKAAAARNKSMSEIQQEEAREVARLAKNSGGGGGSGWANIAATGGSTAWGGVAAKNTAAGVVTPAAQPVASTQKSGGNNNAAWNAKKQSQAAAAAKKSSQSKASEKTAENFGSNGQMTPSLEVWCKEQMKRLNGSDDLTLVQFCMTLTDKDEIRQYLTAYLGSTPQVNNFATEFTKKIGLDSGKEEPQWEGVSKKNKKVRGKK